MTKYKIAIGTLVLIVIGLVTYIIYFIPQKPTAKKNFTSLEEHKSYAIKYGEDLEEAFGELEFGMSEEEVNVTLAIMSKKKTIWKGKYDLFYIYQFKYDLQMGYDIKMDIMPSFHNNKLYDVNLSLNNYKYQNVLSSELYKLIESYKLKYGTTGWYGEQSVDDYFNHYARTFTLSRIDGNRMIEIYYSLLENGDTLLSIQYTNLQVAVYAENESFDDI